MFYVCVFFSIYYYFLIHGTSYPPLGLYGSNGLLILIHTCITTQMLMWFIQSILYLWSLLFIR